MLPARYDDDDILRYEQNVCIALDTACIISCNILIEAPSFSIAHSGGAVVYTDCISAEG